jgi:hypothetical protein
VSHVLGTPGTVPWLEYCQSIQSSPQGSSGPGWGTPQCAIHSGQRRMRSRCAAVRCGMESCPCAGWKTFNLNHVQHKASLARLASFDAQTVGVGHGDPITEDAADCVHRLAETY